LGRHQNNKTKKAAQKATPKAAQKATPKATPKRNLIEYSNKTDGLSQMWNKFDNVHNLQKFDILYHGLDKKTYSYRHYYGKP